MPNQTDEISKLKRLESNLAQTLGSIEILREQKAVIREEIAKVQGRLEILNQILEKKEEDS